MPAPADLFGLCAVAALCAAAIARLGVGLLAPRHAPRRWIVFFALAWLLLLLPLGDLPLGAYARGMTGDPSVSSLVVFGTLFWRGENTEIAGKKCLASQLLVLAAGALLYPLALGAGALDPYRWGFGDARFVAAILALAFLAHARRWPLAPTAIALAVLAWSGGLYESRNLWDYLIDPWLVLYVLGALGRRLWRVGRDGLPVTKE